jgi:hypothetical protein
MNELATKTPNSFIIKEGDIFESSIDENVRRTKRRND